MMGMPPRFGAPRADETRGHAPFMGPLAVYYLRQILEGSPPPPGMAYAAATGERSIAFKTGTSYGFPRRMGGRIQRAIGRLACGLGGWRARRGRARSGVPRCSAADAGCVRVVAAGNARLPGRTAGRGHRGFEQCGIAGGAAPVGRGGGAGAACVRIRCWIIRRRGRWLIWWRRGAGYQAGDALRARGGVGPYRWVVNGVPQAGHGEELPWTPDGPGFAVVTLIDALDRAASGRFRLE